MLTRLGGRGGRRWGLYAALVAACLAGGATILSSGAQAARPSPLRTISFSGFTWTVKSSPGKVGPGPNYNHREIDVEFARWGNAADPTNGQYVAQPYDGAGNLLWIVQPAGAVPSTHGFTWGGSSVVFSSSSASPGSWTYSGPGVPAAGGENARMNLWLFRGAAPLNGQTVEVIVKSFNFAPAP